MKSDDAKTIHISLAIGLLEIVRYDENHLNPKSARSSALNNLIDNAQRVCDFYRVNSWPPHKLSKASSVLDEIEALIKKRFEPPKTRVIRGEKGRFQRVAV